MLFGEDFGGRHEGALRPRVDGHGSRQGGHHGLARAHIPLKQSVHGNASREIVRDFLGHAMLGAGQSKRQGGQQLRVQTTRHRHQSGSAQHIAFAFALQLGQLLRE